MKAENSTMASVYSKLAASDENAAKAFARSVTMAMSDKKISFKADYSYDTSSESCIVQPTGTAISA